MLKNFKAKCIALINKDREYFQYNQGDLVYLISPLMLYNILLTINCYIGNSTTKCHSRSMSDNRDLTETFHQNISSHYKVIASAF